MMRQRNFSREPAGGSSGSLRIQNEQYHDFNDKGVRSGSGSTTWALIALSLVLAIGCLYLFYSNISLSSGASELKLSLIEESARQVKEMSDRLAELTMKNEKITTRLETEQC